MKSIIVGTAGHVDHGKTALVKALTGIDADRLQEEKRRGITIDLGFAHLELPLPGGDTLRIGFVDVPGHERFVRNMLAGVGGIDLVLLVIAADESIKPQTREHFDILRLLGVKRGITVLTKSDAVDSETLDVVRLEVEEFLRGTFLEPPHSPVVAVSALTGAGIEELKQAIVRVAGEVQTRDSAAIPRLPIDRVFTMKGFGTVVTGTLLSGTIKLEDELEVFPSATRVRVRGVQVHGRSANQAIAGQRTALNLAGIAVEDLDRGMMLSTPATFAATRSLDVRLHLLPSAPHALKDRAKVHFHAYSMESVAEVVFSRFGTPESSLGANKQMAPGTDAFARLKLPQSALFLPGDRFIIRQFSPVVTIGGGVVLDATPVPRSRPNLDFLRILAGEDRKAILESRISRHQFDGVALADLVAQTGSTKSVILRELAEPLENRRIQRCNDVFLSVEAWNRLKAQIVSAVRQFHTSNPLVEGISRKELQDLTRARRNPVFEGILQALSQDKKIAISADLIRLPGHGVVMKDEEAESKKKIEGAFSVAGLKVPALNEVLAGLKIDKVRAQKIVTLLLRERVLIKISDELVFHRSALESLRGQLTAQKTKSSKIDVASFKEMTGVSRKYAIPLLEYLDRERVTKRVGDAREIL